MQTARISERMDFGLAKAQPPVQDWRRLPEAQMSTQDTTTAVNRTAMALVGAAAGAAAWFFADMAEEVITQPRLFLFSVTAVMGFFAVLLGIYVKNRTLS